LYSVAAQRYLGRIAESWFIPKHQRSIFKKCSFQKAFLVIFAL